MRAVALIALVLSLALLSAWVQTLWLEEAAALARQKNATQTQTSVAIGTVIDLPMIKP